MTLERMIQESFSFNPRPPCKGGATLNTGENMQVDDVSILAPLARGALLDDFWNTEAMGDVSILAPLARGALPVHARKRIDTMIVSILAPLARGALHAAPL